MKKIFFLLLGVVLTSCKPILVTNYKVTDIDGKNYYTNNVERINNNYCFSEIKRNGKIIYYYISVNKIKSITKK